MTDLLVHQNRQNRGLHVALISLGAAAFLLAVGLTYWQAAYWARNPDPFAYAQVAKEMLAGKRLYSQTWQDKPPLAFFLYAVPQLLGFRTYNAIGFLQGIWIGAQALLFFAVFRRNVAAALGCVAFTALIPLIHPDLSWPSTEQWANPFLAGLLLLGYVIWRDRRFSLGQCVLLGALLVIASQIRQNAAVAGVLPIGAILLCPDTWPRKLAAAGVTALVAAICWGILLLILMHIADLHLYFYTVFKYPQLYAGAGGFIRSLPIPHGPHLLRSAAIALFFFALILPTLHGRNRWFVLCLIFLGVFLVLMPRRPFTHYWVSFYPFLALAIGVTVQSSSEQWPRARWAVVGTIVAVGLLGAIFQFRNYQGSPSTGSFQHIAATVDQIAPPGSTLLAMGPMTSMNGAAVTFASTLPAANTYFLLFQIEPPFCKFLPTPLPVIMDQYIANPPGVLAVQKDFLAATSDPKDTTNSIQLLRRLLRTYQFTPRATDGDYTIFVRQSDPR